MNFNSFHYVLLFLPIVFIAVTFARQFPARFKLPQICILIASLVFYTSNKPINVLYLLGSIAANWKLAELIDAATGDRRGLFLRLGILLNILYLGLFKYINFFAANIPFAHRFAFKIPELAFPLGISFFTITQISYLMECHEGLLPAASLFDHATFISFFPSIISGPIARADRIHHQLPTLNSRIGPDAKIISRAVFLFSLGLIKKVVFADAFAVVANYGFALHGKRSVLESWCFVSAYVLQIYFDFSGYSDMAIASALAFGIDLPRNFDAPLRSLSITEFWQRWHISLSSFITSYLYTPIVRSFRRGTLIIGSFATLVSMTIAGLWHGPTWGFVVFGLLHGSGLALNGIWRRKKYRKPPAVLSWLLTFALVDVGFVFFRYPTLSAALQYLHSMVDWHNLLKSENLVAANGAGLMLPIYVLVQLTGIVIAFIGPSSEQLARDFKPTRWNSAAAVACTLIAWLFMNSSLAKPFVYFAF